MEIRTILHWLCTSVTFLCLRKPLLSPPGMKINKKKITGKGDKAAEYSLMRLSPV